MPFETFPALTWTVDAGGQVLWGNRAWRAYTGHTGEPALSLPGLIHPEDLFHLDALKGTETGSADVRLRKADGTFGWVRLGIAALEAGHGERLLSGTEIGDLRQAGQERQLLQDVLDASTECIKILDLDARLLSMNAGGMAVMEIEDFDVCHHLLWPTFWEGEARSKVEAALEQARAGHSSSFEGAAATLKGTRKWWEILVAPLRDENGQVYRIAAISKDVTDRKAAEDAILALNATLEGQVAQRTRQLEEEHRRLRETNEVLETFIYSVSHDLRTPVRHIGSFSDLLKKSLGNTLDPKAARYLGIITDAVGRMNTLLDALLDFSRVERLPLESQPVDLARLVPLAQQDVRGVGSASAARWEIAPLPVVQGDPRLLRKVMEHLLSNALKYSRTREEAVIEVWAEERPEEWAIFVRDNGVGYHPDYSSRLFGAFQRLHPAEEFGGLGMGLANVRRLVLRHGGTVFSQGQPEAGATFGFTLPKPLPDTGGEAETA